MALEDVFGVVAAAHDSYFLTAVRAVCCVHACMSEA